MFSCKHDIGAFYNPMTSSKTLHAFPVKWGKSWWSELLSLAFQLDQIFTIKKIHWWSSFQCPFILYKLCLAHTLPAFMETNHSVHIH